jgi:hypothetical protein
MFRLNHIFRKGSTKVRGLLLNVFMQCVHLHQERKHFLWHGLQNFEASLQLFAYRSAHGGSPGYFRVRQPITLIA